MSNEVPTRIRTLVHQREQGRCLRCGGPAAELAHRRTRAVHDEHTHCACNLWYGCRTCHQTWQHGNPTEALDRGFAVSRFGDPRTEPVDTWYGRLWLECDGGIKFVIYQEGATDGTASSND